MCIIMPEKFTANTPDQTGLFFLEPDPAQKLPNVTHPVSVVVMVQVCGGGQYLFDVFIHAFQFKRVGKVRVGQRRSNC